jgi:2-keto-4-pentenoate hydratase
MTRLSVLKAAEYLLWSRRSGAAPRDLPGELEPADLEHGYAIQLETVKLRGEPVAGYKIGLTHPAAQQAAGVSAPIAGRLAPSDIVREAGTIRLAPQHLRIVEAELVFEIGRTLSESDLPVREQTLRDSVSAVYAGIELCNSRLSAADPPLPSIVADNGNADRLIIGEPLADWQARLRAELPVLLTRGSGEPVHGSSLRVLGSPLKAVLWLANWLISRGERLQAGALVASGSCTGMTEIARNDVVTAVFGGTAKVTAEFKSMQNLIEARA